MKSSDFDLQMYRTRGKLIDGHPGCTQPVHQGGSSMEQRIPVNGADEEDLCPQLRKPENVEKEPYNRNLTCEAYFFFYLIFRVR